MASTPLIILTMKIVPLLGNSNGAKVDTIRKCYDLLYRIRLYVMQIRSLLCSVFFLCDNAFENVEQ
jgi:hypothetical protein